MEIYANDVQSASYLPQGQISQSSSALSVRPHWYSASSWRDNCAAATPATSTLNPAPRPRPPQPQQNRRSFSINPFRRRYPKMPVCCDIVFHSEPLLYRHLRSTVHGKGIPCATCRAGFESQELLDRHNRDGYHLQPPRPLPPRWACEQCGAACLSKFFLSQHKIHFHLRPPVEKPPVQPDQQIPPTPPTPAAPPTPTRRVPTQRPVPQAPPDSVHTPPVRRFYCTPCARGFTNQQTLDSHHCSGLHALQLRCEACPALFRTRLALDQHRSTAHPAARRRNRSPANGQRLACAPCHRTFANMSALDQHLMSKAHPENRNAGAGAAPGQVWACDECGSMFVAKDLLTLHAAAHVEERSRR